MNWFSAAIALTVALGATRVASAATPAAHVALSYDVPTSCPAVPVFEDAVRARRPDVVFGHGASVELFIEEGGPGFRGWMEIAGNTTRTVEGATCGEVVEALALILAVSFDALDPEPPTPVPPPGPPARPLVATPKPPASQPTFGVAARTSAFLVPEFGASLLLGVAADVRFLGAAPSPWLAIALTRSLTRSASELGADSTTRFTLAHLSLCPHAFGGKRLFFAPCASIVAGLFEVAAGSFNDVTAARREWLSTGVEARIAGSLGVFEATLHLGATAPLVRHVYVAEQRRADARTPRIVAELGISLGLRFW